MFYISIWFFLQLIESCVSYVSLHFHYFFFYDLKNISIEIFWTFLFFLLFYLCLSFLLYYRYRFCLMKLKHSDLPTKHSFIHEWQFTKHFSRMGNQICPKIFFFLLTILFKRNKWSLVISPTPPHAPLIWNKSWKQLNHLALLHVEIGTVDLLYLMIYLDLRLTSAPRLSGWMVDQITYISWPGLALSGGGEKVFSWRLGRKVKKAVTKTNNILSDNH